MLEKFNIRIYGLLINDDNEILVSDELIGSLKITKFPGGGLEFGEGTMDCLKREFLEEMNLKIEVVEHFYTTDFYQQSFLNKSHQIISIYYKVRAIEDLQVIIKTKPFDFNEKEMALFEKNNQIESFRFIPISLLQPEMLTLPIDQIVAKKLIQN
jgi:8-oxo-dGTP diphosphatase